MDRLASIKERLEDVSTKRGMELYDAREIFSAHAEGDIDYLLQRLERYETLIKQARDKTQILASHCAYVKGIGYNLDAQDTFEKSQKIYELLKDGADATISP